MTLIELVEPKCEVCGSELTHYVPRISYDTVFKEYLSLLKQSRADEFAYVIVRGGPVLEYLTFRGGEDQWSGDHLHAVRFARQEDANTCLTFLNAFAMLVGRILNARVEEHAWMLPPPDEMTPETTL